jgi:hypothetical protein
MTDVNRIDPAHQHHVAVEADENRRASGTVPRIQFQRELPG